MSIIRILVTLYSILGVGGHVEKKHGWGYGPGNGPGQWPGTCRGGARQSPIDINPSLITVVSMPSIQFVNYNRPGLLHMNNNGHSVTVTGFQDWPKQARPYIKEGGLGAVYHLLQFHFHWSEVDHEGSEHRLGSLHYPLELHFVHIKEGLTLQEALSRSDGLAVVGVFYARDENDRPLHQLSLPLNTTYPFGSKTEVMNLKPSELLPKSTEVFYRYNGSLTTPTCNEAVIWTLLAQPSSVSDQQLSAFRRHLSSSGQKLVKNYRPVQPLNGRKVLFRPRTSAGKRSPFLPFSILQMLTFLPLVSILAENSMFFQLL